MPKPLMSVRSMLKNFSSFETELRETSQEGSRTRYLFDVFYDKTNGTLSIGIEQDKIVVATLAMTSGKVITLANDANLAKLAKQVLKRIQ